MVGRGVRRLGYHSPLYAARLGGRHPIRLRSDFPDPWTGDAKCGAEMLNGRFAFAGHEENGAGEGLWRAAEQAPPGFRDWLLTFCWLRDLRAAGPSRAARLLVETMVRSFMGLYGDWHPLVWKPALIGRRLQLFTGHADAMLASSDMVYRSTVINMMARERRHLARTIRDANTGPDRIDALAGIILSGLALSTGEAQQARLLKQLCKELEDFILPDGGPVSRKPADALTVGRSLATLGKAMQRAEQLPPDRLQVTLDRIGPFLKGLSHADEGLAQFNGAFMSDGEQVAAFCETAGATGQANRAAPQSGYLALKRQRTLAIIDVGPPPARHLSLGAHAGALAFEMSDGKDRIVVNVGGTLPGLAGPGAEVNLLAATTAGHSTLVLDDRNSAELLPDGRIGDGATEVSFKRLLEDASHSVTAVHNGYLQRYGVLHERRLSLSKNGDSIDGADRLFIPEGGSHLAKGREVAVRFHLHPDVGCSLTHGEGSVILRLPHGHGWAFSAEGRSPHLEDSIFVSRPGVMRRTRQIVLSSQMAEPELEIKWSLKRLDSRP